MIQLDPFWLCTNSIPVKDPVRVFRIAKELGFRNVELSAIDGNNEQIVAEEVTPAFVGKIASVLDREHVRCIALSAHTDLTDDACFARFLKKVRFAGEIGASQINTRCGPKKDMDAFLRHIRELIPILERYGLQLNLESYGDIVNDAASSAHVFQILGHPLLRYNYDAGNLYRFTHGKLDFEEDLPKGIPYLGCIHLKDVVMRDGYLYNTAVGRGVVGYDGILETLSAYRTSVAAGLEVPLGFRVRDIDLFKQIVPADQGMAEKMILCSAAYLETLGVLETTKKNGDYCNESTTCNDPADEFCETGRHSRFSEGKCSRRAGGVHHGFHDSGRRAG